jgi:PAS domain-containing protein
VGSGQFTGPVQDLDQDVVAGEHILQRGELLIDGKAAGTVWLIAHDEKRKFDGEDARLLASLARFASAAHQIWSNARDIARRDRTSEDRFRRIADYAPVMFWVTEPDGYCSYLSQSWYQFTGQAPDAGIGFEWKRSKAHEETGLYHGVWADRSDGKGETLKARLDQLVGDTDRFQKSGPPSPWLSYWEYLDPVGPVLAHHAAEALENEDSTALEGDAETYQGRLIARAEDIWDEFAPLVDQALAEVRS